MADARGIDCEQCGGGIPLLTLSNAVRCPHCGHRQAVGAQTHHELSQYAAAVHSKMVAANRELQKAEAWKQWSESGRTPKQSLSVGYGLMIGVPIFVALTGFFMYRIGLFEVHGPALSFIIMGASYAGVIGYLVWFYRGRRRAKRQNATTEAAKVACPNCGAPNLMHAGQVLESCAHCGAALIPTNTIMSHGLSAAQKARRQALLERYRAERRGMAHLLGHSANAFIPYLAFGSLIPTMVPAAVVFSWQMFVTGEEPFHPAIFLLWAMTAALVGGLVGFFFHRRNQRAAFREALSDLARQFRGKVSDQTSDLVGWLDRNWAAEYRTTWLWKGVYFHVASIDALGFPTLIDVEPNGYQHRGAGYPARLHIVVSAFVPGVTDGGEGPRDNTRAQEIRSWLAKTGFRVHVTEGGLLALADAPTIKRVRKDPSTLHELSPIIHAMAELAAGLGGTPAD